MAAIGAYLPLVKFLLEKGADPKARDIDGRTPTMVAAAHGHEKLQRLFKHWGRKSVSWKLDANQLVQTVSIPNLNFTDTI